MSNVPEDSVDREGMERKGTHQGSPFSRGAGDKVVGRGLDSCGTKGFPKKFL